MLLGFRDDEVNCPCPVEIQELLRDFHHLLKAHCGRKTYTTDIFRRGENENANKGLFLQVLNQRVMGRMKRSLRHL